MDGSVGPSEKPYEVEEKYSRLESAASVIRDKLIGGTPPSELSSDERQGWAEFVATLEQRTPRRLRFVEAAGMAMREQLRQENRLRFFDADYADEIFAEIDYEALARNAARTTVLVNRNRLAKPLADWQWTCASHPNLNLITADYPIGSLLHAGDCVAISLPLSPTTLFIAAASPIDRTGAAWVILASNLLLIYQKPNFIYSKDRLEDGEVFRFLKAADDTLAEPEGL